MNFSRSENLEAGNWNSLLVLLFFLSFPKGICFCDRFLAA
jgi:hypothetical protein